MRKLSARACVSGLTHWHAYEWKSMERKVQYDCLFRHTNESERVHVLNDLQIVQNVYFPIRIRPIISYCFFILYKTNVKFSRHGYSLDLCYL